MEAGARCLARAVTLAPGDASLKAALQLLRGTSASHQRRGREGARRAAQAQQEFTEALVAFREAAALRPNWPDPFLGLARTFIYGLEDVDRGADALAQAEKRGHAPGERETTQLADGYRARGETLLRTSQTLKDLPQERDYLTRAADAFREALTRYANVSGFGNAAVNIRDTQKRLDRVEERLAEISRLEGAGRGTDVYAGEPTCSAGARSVSRSRWANTCWSSRQSLSRWRSRSRIWAGREPRSPSTPERDDADQSECRSGCGCPGSTARGRVSVPGRSASGGADDRGAACRISCRTSAPGCHSPSPLRPLRGIDRSSCSESASRPLSSRRGSPDANSLAPFHC